MKYTIDRQEDHLVFVVHEERIDSALAPNLKSELLLLHSEGVRSMVLDLSEVKYTDSSGLSALLVGNRIFNDSGGVFVLAALSPHVEKLINISQLTELLNIAPDVEEAVRRARAHTATADEGKK